MSKLTKYLASKTKDVKINPSGSIYYSFGRFQIRVSDHVSPIKGSQDLNIFVSGNSNIIYVVSLDNKIYTFVRFSEIKGFIDNWLLMSHHFDSMMDRTSSEALLKASARLEHINKEISKAISSLTAAQGDYKDVLTKGGFTPAQVNTIRSFMEQNKKNLKKAKKKQS